MKYVWRWCILFTVAITLAIPAAVLEIRKEPIHLRSGGEREWNEFPAPSSGPALRQTFHAETNAIEYTLSLRQRDVKNATWTVRINGRDLGMLAADERDMGSVFTVPAGVLVRGENSLEVSAKNAPPSDDIELRDIRLIPLPRAELLRQSTVVVETGALPVRVTIVDSDGALVPLAPLANPEREAVRTGVIYTADGRTEFGLPAGNYEVFASRGWQYSAPSRRLTLRVGQKQRVGLSLRREVNLPGYIGCDTHVHTLELSGHGDATVRERVITAAGEGLDIIVATEHNRTTDYSETIRKLGLERFLTAVRGNEVTTPIGHFNIFPLQSDAPAPDSKQRDWQELSRSIRAPDGVKVIVQNHPRDIHLGYRPFDPAHHLSSVGENLIGRPMFANAVEVINSGAMYSDMLQLVLDWMGLLNRGYRVAAIGASDTHTVDFVPIGQARTMIRADRVEAAFERLAAGENLVSYGLAAIVRVAKQNPLVVDVEVHGPSWSSADRVTVYANGFPMADYPVKSRKWSRRIQLARPVHDVTVVAVASGPGVRRPFWEVRKPYQPVSKDWVPRVMGISSAVRIDVDGNGFQSPWDYANALLTRKDWMRDLTRYDASVAIQVLSILAARGQAPQTLRDQFEQQGPVLKKAYATFLADWEKNSVRQRR